MSDADSQFEDGAEDDEDHFEEPSNDNVVGGASDTLEADEASFVDSREDLDEDRSDSESID